MKLLYSSIAKEDLELMLSSDDEDIVKAGETIIALLDEIGQNNNINWARIRQNKDHLEIFPGFYLSACIIYSYKYGYSCGIYRLKFIGENGKIRRDLNYRIAVGQSSRAMAKLGVLSIFPRCEDGDDEDGYSPETEQGKRILRACEELKICVLHPKK